MPSSLLFAGDDQATLTCFRWQSVMQQLLYTASGAAISSMRTAAAVLVIDMLQLLSFLFASNEDGQQLQWNYTSWLYKVLYAFGPQPYFDAYQSREVHFLVLALLLVTLHAVLFSKLFSSLASSNNVKPPPWLVKCYRAVLLVFSTVLYIPIFTALFAFAFSLFKHGSEWGGGGAGAVVGGVIVMIIAATHVFVCTAAVMVCFDTNSAGENPLARPHARAELIHHLARTALVIVSTVYVKPGALAAFLVVCILPVAYAYYFFLPYYRFQMCQLRVITMTLVAWGAICAVVASLQQPEDGAAPLLLYVASPIVAAFGLLITNARRQRLLITQENDLKNPYEVELKVRFFLERALSSDISKAQMIQSLLSETYGDGSYAKVPANHPNVMTSRTADNLHIAVDGGDYGAAEAGSGGAGGGCPMMVKSGSRLEEHVSEEDQYKRRAFNVARRYYEAAAKRFNKSCMMFIFRAEYHFQQDVNRQFSMQQLVQAAERHPRLDERFLIFKFQKLHEEFLTADAEELLSYTAYRDHLAKATDNDLRGSQAQISFWTLLQEPKPDLEQLHSIGEEINTNVVRARTHYEAAMAIYSQSPQELRSFAGFLMDLVNDTERAEQLLARADEIENNRMRRKEVISDNHLDIFDDRNAVVQIDRRNLFGEIVSVNAGTGRMFGYTQQELLGKNVSSLLPSPYSDLHDRFLQAYVETGNEHIINRVRRLYGLHKSGHIFPLYIRVQQISRTAFMGVMKGIETDEFTIFVRSSGIIAYWTTNCVNVFGCLCEVGREIPITQCFADYTDIRSNHMSSMGGTIVLSVNGVEKPHTMWIEPQYVHGIEYDMVRLRENRRSSTKSSVTAESPTNIVLRRLSLTANSNGARGREDNVSEAQSVHHLSPPTAPRTLSSGASLLANPAVPKELTRRGHDMPRLPNLLISVVPVEDIGDSGAQSPTAGSGDATEAKDGEALLDHGSSSAPQSPFNFHASPAAEHTHDALKLSSAEDEHEDPNESPACLPDSPENRQIKPRTLEVHTARSERSGAVKSHKSGHSHAKTNLISLTSARTENTADALRRVFLSDSGKSASGFKTVRGVFTAVILLMCAAAAAAYVCAHVNLHGFMDALDDIDFSQLRAFDSLDILDNVRALTLVQEGVVDADQENYARSRLVTLADNVEKLQKQLFLDMEGSDLSAAHRRLLERPSIEVVELYGNDSITRELNLHQVVSTFVSNARLIEGLDLSDITTTQPNVFFLLNNFDGHVLHALNKSTSFFVSHAESHTKKMTEVDLGFMIAVLIFGSAVVLFVGPFVSRVKGKKTEVLSLFLQLPPKITADLLERSTDRVQRLGGEDEEDAAKDTADDEEQRDVDDARDESASQHNRHEMSETPTKNKEARILKTQGSVSERGGGGPARGTAANVVDRLSHAENANSEASAAKRRIWMQISLMLLVSAPYFVAMFLWSSSFADIHDSSATQIKFAGERRLTSLQISHLLKEQYVSDNTTFIDDLADRIRERVNWERYVHQSLLYGSSHLHLPASVRTDPRQDRLLFGTNCNAKSASNCSTYHLGLNLEGLNAAQEEYLRVALYASVSRSADASPTPHANASDLQFIDTMQQTYLRDGLLRSQRFFDSDCQHDVEHFLSIRLWLMLGFIVILLLMYQGFYLGLIRRLQEDFTSTRALLLILPVEVMQSVKAIRSFIKSNASSL